MSDVTRTEADSENLASISKNWPPSSRNRGPVLDGTKDGVSGRRNQSNLDLLLELRPLAVDLDAELPVVELPLPLGGVGPRILGGVSVGAEAESRTIAL